MPNQQLIEYIRKAREGGMNDGTIKEGLIGAGWSLEATDEALGVRVVTATRGRAKKIIVVTTVVTFLLIAGGDFAYWHFIYQPIQASKNPTINISTWPSVLPGKDVTGSISIYYPKESAGIIKKVQIALDDMPPITLTPPSYQFDISPADTSIVNHVLYAQGFSEDGTILDSKWDEISVEPAGNLNQILALPCDLTLDKDNLGSTLDIFGIFEEGEFIHLNGLFANNYQRGNVESGIQVRADNPRIVSVYDNYFGNIMESDIGVSGVSGTTNVNVSYDGKSTVVPVSVSQDAVEALQKSVVHPDQGPPDFTDTRKPYEMGIIPPLDHNLVPGSALNLIFDVNNGGKRRDDYIFSVKSSRGWSVLNIPWDEVTVDSSYSSSVGVKTVIPETAFPGDKEVITLTVQSKQDVSLSASSTVEISVHAPSCPNGNNPS